MTTLGYLRDTITGERIDFQFNPSDLPVKVSASWTEHEAPGSSHRRRHFKSTSGRSESMSLTFIRRNADGSDVDALRKRLESLPFPDYAPNGRLQRGPHPILLVFGGMRSLRVLVTEVSLAHGPWFHPETTAPGELRATIAWADSPAEGDLSRDDVRAGR